MPHSTTTNGSLRYILTCSHPNVPVVIVQGEPVSSVDQTTGANQVMLLEWALPHGFPTPLCALRQLTSHSFPSHFCSSVSRNSSSISSRVAISASAMFESFTANAIKDLKWLSFRGVRGREASIIQECVEGGEAHNPSNGSAYRPDLPRRLGGGDCDTYILHSSEVMWLEDVWHCLLFLLLPC
jgi:hypothetical protein